MRKQPAAVKKASAAEYRIPDGVNFEADVEYGRVGERSLTLDLFRPKNQGDRMLPVVVYIHGGGWERGNKNEGHRVLSELVLSGNYAAVTVAYRLSGEAIWPAQIHDCKAAIRWMRANARKYGLDPDRIGTCGGSAGGHLAALVGVSGGVTELEGACGNPGYSSRVQCVAATSGAYDFAHFYEQTAGKSNSNRAQMVVRQLLGGTPAEQPDTARSASAVDLRLGRRSAVPARPRYARPFGPLRPEPDSSGRPEEGRRPRHLHPLRKRRTHRWRPPIPRAAACVF